jgi:hypothetical protein
MQSEWFDLSDDELKARLTQKSDIGEFIAEQLVAHRDDEGTAHLIDTVLQWT